jgi:hypothetical protein
MNLQLIVIGMGFDLDKLDPGAAYRAAVAWLDAGGHVLQKHVFSNSRCITPREQILSLDPMSYASLYRIDRSPLNRSAK